MKDLSIKNIIEATKGKLLVGNEEYICMSYSKDTRTIKEGDCYIGIKKLLTEIYSGKKL